MKLKDMPIEELELLSYTDLSYKLIKENKTSMNTPALFREICNLLGYSDSEFTSKIGDYYTSLTIDKRFVLLENNEWDIRDHHAVEVVLDDEDEEMDEEESEDVDEDEEVDGEESEDIDEVIDDEIIDDEELEDLSIVDEEELEE